MSTSGSHDCAANFSLALANALPTLVAANIERLAGVFNAAGVETVTEMQEYGTSEFIVRACELTPRRCARPRARGLVPALHRCCCC